MNNRERTISTATVVALGFVVLGILNLISTSHYSRNFIKTTGRLPGILFILTGIVIFIIHTVRKKRE